MPQVVVCLVDVIGSDDVKTAELYKRGDVISIHPDDRDLTAYPGMVKERDEGRTAWINVTTGAEINLLSMLIPEPGFSDPQARLLGQPMRRRGRKFDVDQWIADDKPSLNLGQFILRTVAKSGNSN